MAVDGWSGMLTDAVVKCGRDSERKLYMYGISSSRCHKCRARLSSDSNTCGSCQYTHKTARKCTRCSQKNDPVMWCAECDAYFCAGCHKKPHVLMLGSSKPHHCFAIDGVSGKQFVEASWADEFAAMLQATYRLRLQDKMLAEEKAANAKNEAVTAPQQQQSAAKGAANQATPALEPETQPQRPADSSSSSNGAPVSAPAVNDVAVAPSTSFSTAPPSAAAVQSSSSALPHAQEQSRKRQLPGPDSAHDRNQKAIRPENPSHSGGGAATTPPTDGMSLYDRVKAMHDMRAKAAKAKPQVPPAMMRLQQHREPDRRKDEEQAEQLRKLQEKLARERAEKARRLERERVERLKAEREEKQRQEEEKQRQENQRRWQEQQRLERDRAERLRLEKQQQQQQQRAILQRQEEERKQRQEETRLWEEQRRQDQIRQDEERQWQQEQREKDAEQQRQEELHRQEFILERQRQQRLAEERLRHEKVLRQQADAQALVRESNMYISQAQHVLHTQPGYVVSSMPPPSISVSMQQTSSTRITRVPSPGSVSPHAPRFQQVSTPPTTQTYPFQAAPGPPVSNGYPSMGNDHSAQTFEVGPPVMESRFETIANEQEENHHLVVRNPNGQHQQSEQQQAEFSAAMVPHGGAAGFSPSKSGEDDELRAVWVSDYDNVNALILQLDLEITKRTDEGHAFVHQSNNITIPEELKLQINNLRAQREQALTKRFESVVRVLIFSGAVRSFAQQNENIMNDVPAALTASHKKCAELAADIREFERQAQKLREGIDEAVSSGNPAQMQNVAHLGALIADVERKIHLANAERDKQFIFMFQFSGRLRDMVRAEWAKPARSYN